MEKQQGLIGAIVAGKVIDAVVGIAVDKFAKKQSTSLEQHDVPELRIAVSKAVKEEISQREQHVTNTEPAYKSRVTQGSLVIALASITELTRLWQDGVENTPMDYGMHVVALIGVAWALYGRWVATKPFGA